MRRIIIFTVVYSLEISPPTKWEQMGWGGGWILKGKAHVLSVCLPFSLELRLKRVPPATCVCNKGDK